MELLPAALLFNGTLVLGLHVSRRSWTRALEPLLCLALLPYHPGWGMALLLGLSALPQKTRLKPELQAFRDLSKARDWIGTIASYEALETRPPAWVHLLACRAYARQARFEQALHSLKQAQSAPPQLPPHYACMTMALAGSPTHLESWLPRLKNWPEHSLLHTRAICQARAGHLEAARALWERASHIAPPHFLPLIEEDRANPQPVTLEPEILDQLQRQFQKLDRHSRMAHARLGPQALGLILLTCLAYAFHPPLPYLAQTTLPQGLITSLFVHFNLTHLALNMLALAGLSPLVELLYPKRFLLFYFLTGAVAGLAQLAVTPQAHLIGASGAVMALLGARLALLLRFPDKKQLIILLLIFAIQIVVDQLVPHLGGVAHIWGAFSGFAITLLSRPKDLTHQTARA